MQIPISKLNDIQTIVSHLGCPDGIASAMIVSDVLPGREILWASYQSEPIEPRPGMLFVDFSPPKEQAEEFRKVGAIVLDHHKTARTVVKTFEYHAFGDESEDPGVSGAVLAVRHVWNPIYDSIHPGSKDFFDPGAVSDFAQLAGIRDTWQKTNPRWDQACAQAEMLTFYPISMWLPHSPGLLRVCHASEMAKRLEVGRIALAKKLESAQRIAGQVFYFQSPEGTKVAIVPTLRVSDTADYLRPDTQLCIGFNYTFEQDKVKLLLSTRSRNGYDCSKFCSFYGGGGHTGAAGCQRTVHPDSMNPYTTIQRMMESFESFQDT